MLAGSEEAEVYKPLLAELGRGSAQAKLASKEAALEEDLAEVASVEFNHVAGRGLANNVSQTFYVSVLFPKCKKLQLALVDTGAQLFLITTTCARFLQLSGHWL